jgi:outer membrane usher protein
MLVQGGLVRAQLEQVELAVAPLCSIGEDQALQVLLAGVPRGTFLVRRNATTTIIESSAFTPSEKNYIIEKIRCEGTDFVRLWETIATSYSEEEQSLAVTPKIALLPNNDVDLGVAVTLDPLPVQPIYGLDYGLGASRSSSNSWNQRALLGVSLLQGQFSARTTVLQRYNNDQFNFTPQVRLSYQLSDNWAVLAGLNTDPAVSNYNGFGTALTGVALEGQFGLSRILPSIMLELPLEADVAVFVGDRLLKRFAVAPGTLTLRNITVSDASGEVSVRWRDARGSQLRSFPYKFPASQLPPGGFRIAAQGGLLNSEAYGGGKAQLGIAEGWSIEGSIAAYYNKRYSGDLFVNTISDNFGLRLGMTWNYIHYDQIDGRIVLATNYNLSPFAVSASINLPVQDWQPSINANLNLNLKPLTFSLSGGYDLRKSSAQAGLGVSWAVVEGISINSGLNWSDQGLSLSIGAGLQLDNNLNFGFASNNALPFDGNQMQNNLNLNYKPDSSQNFSLSSDLRRLSGTYTMNRDTALTLGADSGGNISGDINGTLALFGGNVYLTPKLQGVGLLIQTAVAGIPIYAGGQYRGITNGNGDLLITDLPKNQVFSIGVKFEDLPFTISVANEANEIMLKSDGIAVLDWRNNFRVSRWAQFQWNSQEVAAYGTFTSNDRSFDLDDTGFGLIDDLSDATSGILTSEDGQRSCRVMVRKNQELSSCEAP